MVKVVGIIIEFLCCVQEVKVLLQEAASPCTQIMQMVTMRKHLS